MRLRWILAGAGVLLLVVGAIAYYFTQMPGRLADDYKEEAEPQQQLMRNAMRPVYRTLAVQTFGADTRSINRARNPDQYIRAVDRVTSRQLRRLAPARRQIAKAKRTIEKLDEKALFEPPAWPLLGGRGDLEGAESIAEDEREYVEEASAFLKHYERLVSYTEDEVRFARTFGVTMGRGFDAIPANPTSPGQVTRPLDRTTRRFKTQLASFRKRKAPPEIRKNHKELVALVRFVDSKVRELSSAVKARNLARIEAWEREFGRGLRRFTGAGISPARIVVRSTYAKRVRKLRDRERALLRAYGRL